MLRINPNALFNPAAFGPQNDGYTAVDLDRFLATGDIFQATQGQNSQAQAYLQTLQTQLMASMLMQLDPLALAQLVMLNMLSQRMNGGQRQCGCNLGRMGRRGFASNRSIPSGAWSRTAPSSVSLPGNMPAGRGTSGDFLRAALAQNGDRYVYGAETRLDDANPDTFDCSELVQWSAAQAGVEIPDGSANQRAWVRRNGTEISVEQALRTPGALLFRDGHVAISLGDGRTIEAKGSRYGVGVFNARGRFTSAGLVPGMSYA